MKLASVQQRMGASIAPNLHEIRTRVAEAHDADAELVIFPELALTGFHRGLRAVAERAPIEAEVGALHGDLPVPVLLGTPWWVGDHPVNALVALGPWVDDAPQVAGKIGLTTSEATFFVPASERAVLRVAGFRIGVVFCREVEDLDDVVADFEGRVDLLVWPSFLTWHGDEADYEARPAELARRVGVPLVQCNWPHSHNDPTTRGMGGSRAFDRTGTLVARGAEDEPGILFVDLSGRQGNRARVGHVPGSGGPGVVDDRERAGG